MSKGEGRKIAIKFTDDLVGDVAGNEGAFSVKGKEYNHVNGVLIDGDYQVEKVERYPTPKEWIGDLSIGTFTDTIFEESTGLVLGVDEV